MNHSTSLTPQAHQEKRPDGKKPHKHLAKKRQRALHSQHCLFLLQPPHGLNPRGHIAAKPKTLKCTFFNAGQHSGETAVHPLIACPLLTVTTTPTISTATHTSIAAYSQKEISEVPLLLQSLTLPQLDTHTARRPRVRCLCNHWLFHCWMAARRARLEVSPGCSKGWFVMGLVVWPSCSHCRIAERS